MVITDVPVLATRPGRMAQAGASRVPGPGLRSNAASLRAVHYASTLGLLDTKAAFFASTPKKSSGIRNKWVLRPMPIPLDVEEAQFRDLGDPLLRYLRGITADPDAVAVVVMPELVFSGPQRLLHNQRALYIKRLLLFEPRVILTSVPYRLS